MALGCMIIRSPHTPYSRLKGDYIQSLLMRVLTRAYGWGGLSPADFASIEFNSLTACLGSWAGGQLYYIYKYTLL